jgi:hypothetical protein
MESRLSREPMRQSQAWCYPCILGTGYMARELTQSITVEAGEKLLLDTLATHKRIKPAALARNLLYRGLQDFLADGNIHPREQEADISEALSKQIENDNELRRAREMVRKRNKRRRANSKG